ncbi:hypothetical protein GALMADRAFT_208921 [Galerina marginata CBS 339.88]|uniref:Uncharacterized protein n=1 Tax=Galerina marginata (strain CBS 339.88) TaxID=685588 RepID=A0A067T8U3_GALM3|nr:hypothetical protein GALMADRAFT_208921 [Galerina marginata CBS 339.88]
MLQADQRKRAQKNQSNCEFFKASLSNIVVANTTRRCYSEAVTTGTPTPETEAATVEMELGALQTAMQTYDSSVGNLSLEMEITGIPTPETEAAIAEMASGVPATAMEMGATGIIAVNLSSEITTTGTPTPETAARAVETALGVRTTATEMDASSAANLNSKTTTTEILTLEMEAKAVETAWEALTMAMGTDVGGSGQIVLQLPMPVPPRWTAVTSTEAYYNESNTMKELEAW